MEFFFTNSATLSIALFLMGAIVMIGFVIKCGSTSVAEDEPISDDYNYLTKGEK